MLAARVNQENAVYEQQTAAAAKALNQGVKGLAPKTPALKAPKTPFKGRANDENALLAAGRTVVKGKTPFGLQKDGKLDKGTLVTPPVAPRERLPLGNKTANAKATAFKTPTVATGQKPAAKPTSPRLQRAKVKVYQPDTDNVDENELPEVEYMAPRGVPLPDHPDDWPADRTYPQFEGANMTRGWWSAFAPDQDPEEFSDFEEKLKRFDQAKQKSRSAQPKRKPATVAPMMHKTRKDPLTTQTPSTIKARDAAVLLSQPPSRIGDVAAPKNAAKARLQPAAPSKSQAVNVTRARNPRHTVAMVASNTTLGYSKGRVFSNSRRTPPLAINDSSPPQPNAEQRSDGAKSLATLFNLDDLRVEDAIGDLGLNSTTHQTTAEIDDLGLDDFQLENPGW